MKRPWLFFSILGLSIAAVSLITHHPDLAFVAGAAGAVSWFLDLRSAMQKNVAENEPQDSELENNREDSN